MNTQLQFSIIVPVYNAERYLSECIESILNQTISSFELILVNDGSKDSSPLICDQYATKDSRIKVIHKPNGGVCSARNKGLEIASGEYITFIDSDDWVDLNYLEELIPTGNEDMVCTSLVADNTDLPTLIDSYLDLKRALLLNFTGFAFGISTCKAFKNSIIQKKHIRFKEEISLNEDDLFVFDYLACHIYSITTKSVCTYHYHTGEPTSLSNQIVPFTQSLKNIEFLYNSMQKLALIYNWDNNYALKEYMCGQFYNIIRSIKVSNKTIKEKIKDYLFCLKSYYVYELLKDHNFWITRNNTSSVKKVKARIQILSFDLLYLIIGKPRKI